MIEWHRLGDYDMGNRRHKNVLAVFSLLYYPGRANFIGILEEMGNTSDWLLSVVRPGRFFTEDDLVNELGEPFDGFIISEAGTDAVTERIAASNTPAVLVNIADPRISARGRAFATVWQDNADIGRKAARHLLTRNGFKSAGYVHELRPGIYRPESAFYSDERLWAFRETMGAAGVETSAFPEDNDFGDFGKRLRKWVRGLPKPAAVMACSDMRAADVINACRAEGIAVPGQVAVIGVDNDVSQHARCGMAISSVVQDMRLSCRIAVRELDFLFRHPGWRGRPHEVLVPARGIYGGESTAHSPVAARFVADALDFISANRLRNITAADVVAHLGCSRQLAALRFSEACGKTMHQAIEEARMEEVQRRLRDGASVRDIVRDMRFTSANQLYRIYHRHFGETMRDGASLTQASARRD